MLAIVAPVTFLAAVVYLLRGPAHEQLHEFPGFLYVLAAMTAAVTGFTYLIFGIVARLERRLFEKNAELAQRNQELAAFLAVARAAGSSFRLSDVLDAALKAILAVTSADVAEVWLAHPDGELVLASRHGSSADAFGERSRLTRGEGLPGAAALTGSSVVVHDLGRDPRFVRQAVRELGFETYCALPLRRRAETLGVLGVAARSPEALVSPAEHRLLEGIGEQLAVAVENARLHERVLDGAVVEERERLARELHDGLAQMLAYVNMQTLAIKRLLAADRADDAKEHVAAMESAAKKAYADVRQSILGLRVARRGLLPSLRQYLKEYSRMTGTEVQLEAERALDALELPGTVEIQLLRIVQEALSNVAKHARAASAGVRLEAGGGKLTVEIEDDGCGFAVDRPVRTGWPHFGLQTMRERALAIGGSFEVVSRPGEGTRVVVRAPLDGNGRSDAGPAR